MLSPLRMQLNPDWGAQQGLAAAALVVELAGGRRHEGELACLSPCRSISLFVPGFTTAFLSFHPPESS